MVEMSNATLTYVESYEAKDADLTMTLNRSDLEDIMLGKAKLSELAKVGRAKLEGNANVLQQLAGACEMFDPMFEIMPGTKRVVETLKAKEEVFKQDTPRPHEP